VLSRSQVFEFKTISSKQIADQLRTITKAEKISVDEAALLLIARSAEGSMRDAESALDQVIAFAGQKISADDVATVLGLVGRDLVLDIVTAVADEVPAAAFELSGRAVELGYDLRLVVRELARVVRDLLVLSVDPSRIDDPEIAAEAERGRVQGLAGRFSREDLLRAFDLLSRAEVEIRGAVQPRYHLEMALLRWIHMRKLVPLTELLGGLQDGPSPSRPSKFVPTSAAAPPPASPRAAVAPVERRAAPPPPPPAVAPPLTSEGGKDAFLAEIRKAKMFFYNTVVAQAQKIEFGPDRVTFTFLPAHRTLREQLEQNRPWLESVASAVGGKRMPVGAAQTEAPAAEPAAGLPGLAPPKAVDLKAAAMSDAAVQAMLDVFPADIEDVEEI
jgi:DNA polymerase-3 subunit gamma/tau